jgi:tetratricopeptide (TPR) repeat protein/class 3 adenylate cyclase
MIRYIPPFILQQDEAKAFEGKLEAFVVLFDIMNFTKSCSGLFSQKKDGAERLSRYLEAAFHKPVEAMEYYGGFVSSFAGDACTMIFPQSTGLEIWSAIRLMIKHFQSVHDFQGLVLSIRLAVSYGEIEWRIFPNDYQYEYVFQGNAINEIVSLQDSGAEHIFSASAAAKIGLALFDEVPSGFTPGAGAYELSSEPPRSVEYHFSPAASKLFCHERYYIRKLSEEYRPAGFCFISMKRVANAQIAEVISKIHELADQYLGLVNKLENSDKGFMAIVIFGIPVSGGSTFRDLCNFSLSLVELEPRIAIGLSIGFVLSCYTGSGLSKEYTAFGHPVNLAAKLMAKARGGEILTDAYLRRFMSSYFIFQEAGHTQIKGIDYAVESNFLIRRLEHRDFFLSREFIGRTEEMLGITEDIKHSATNKNNAVIYVSGDPGIGKSKLVKEVLSMDEFDDGTYLKLNVSCEPRSNRALDAIRQIIIQFFKVNFWLELGLRRAQFRGVWQEIAQDDAEMQRIESIIASFLGIEWEGSVWSMLSPTEAKKQSQTAFIILMAKLAAKQPILLQIDDGQWLDHDSLQYLQALSAANVKPIIIISACRYTTEGRVDFGLKHHEVFDYELKPLDSELTGVIVKNLVRMDNEVSGETIEFIDSLAQGIPLFIIQLTLDMLEKGKLDNKGIILSKEGYTPSLGIDDIIGMRIDNLSDQVQQCLFQASVLGNRFHVEVLSRMLDTKLEAELEEGKRNRIWERFVPEKIAQAGYDVDELQYIFSHILIHEVAYSRIMDDKKIKLHFAAANAMERVFAESLNLHAEEIAIHYERANLHNEAAEYYNKAGCYFRDRYSFDEATRCFERALQIREKHNESQNLSNKHPKIAATLNDWAELLIAQGDQESLAHAGQLLERALMVSTSLAGKDSLVSALTYKLKASLMQQLSNFAEAEKLFLLALKIRQGNLPADDPLIADVMHELANHYFRRGNYKKSEAFFRQAIAIRETEEHFESAELADSLNDLAYLHAELDQNEQAEAMFHKALKMRENTLGKYHVDLTETLNDLASYLTDRGRTQEAEPLLARALQIRQDTLGLNHTLVADTLHSIGMLYHEMDDARALDFLNRAQKIRIDVLGTKHPDMAESYHDLAVLYMEKSLYIEAEALLKKALEIREEYQEPNHPEIGESLNELGNVYLGLGNNEEADKCFIRAKIIREKALGKEHSDLAETLNDHANLCIEMGRFADAEKMFRSALQIREKTSGSESLEVGETLNDLAKLFMAQDIRIKEAEAYLQKALKIRKATYSYLHSEIGETMFDLGSLYLKARDFKDAKYYLRRALVFRRKRGKDDLKYVEALEALGKLYAETGEQEDAETLYQEALNTREMIHGSTSQVYAESTSDQGTVYLEKNEFAKASELLRKALLIRNSKLGGNHLVSSEPSPEQELKDQPSDLAESIHDMAKIYVDQGNFKQAESIFIKARQIREKELGHNHEKVAQSIHDLARLYFEQSKLKKALPLFQEALAIRESILPEYHNDIAVNLHDLGIIYAAMDEIELGKQHFRRALNIRIKILGKAHPDTQDTEACLNQLEKP